MSTSVDEIMQRANELSPTEMKELHRRLDEALSNRRAVKTYEEAERELVARGVITVPENKGAFRNDFEPITIKGEPLSETIIRERR